MTSKESFIDVSTFQSVMFEVQGFLKDIST